MLNEIANEELGKLKTLIIGIYCRFSSRNQNQRSNEDQKNRAIKHVRTGRIEFLSRPPKKYDYANAVFKFFSDDAKSGTKTGRDGYDAFKRCIENGECDVAVVDELSRIVRELGEQLDFYYLLKYKNIELIGLNDQISSEAPTAKTHFQLKGIVNEMEREQIAARTRRGLEARVDKGYSCGDICMGYGSRPTQERTQGGRVIPSHYEIYIIQEQAEIVILIFTLFCKGLGLSAIAKELNRRQIPSPPRGQKITGKKVNWASSTVRKILTNPKYIGQWHWGRSYSIYNPLNQKRVKKEVERHLWHQHYDGKQIREDLIIVPVDLWNEAQKRFASSGRMYREGVSRTNAMREIRLECGGGQTLLAGVLRCGECESRMIQITSGFYGCGMHHRKDRTRCSNSRMIKCKKVESKVVETIKEILTRPSVLESATKTLNSKIKKRLSAAPNELKSFQKKQIELEREIQNLLKFIMENGDSSHTVKSTLAEKEAELLFVKQQILMLHSASAEKLLVTPFALKERFDKLGELLATDPVHANAALRRLIPQGLRCQPQSKTQKQNLNQNNSKWTVTGEILVHEPVCKETAPIHFVEPNPVTVDMTL